jgi:hypothetical protein
MAFTMRTDSPTDLSTGHSGSNPAPYTGYLCPAPELSTAHTGPLAYQGGLKNRCV